MRRTARAVILALVLSFASSAAPAEDAIAPDDPALIANMAALCLRAALTSGGIDKNTKPYCNCVAPVFARHMTAQSRYRLAVENRIDVRPEFDDPQTTYDDVVKACPPRD